MKKIKRKIVKHPKGAVSPKTTISMFLETIEEFESVLVMGIRKQEDDNVDGDVYDFIDHSTLELKDLAYYKALLGFEVNRRMEEVD